MTKNLGCIVDDLTRSNTFDVCDKSKRRSCRARSPGRRDLAVGEILLYTRWWLLASSIVTPPSMRRLFFTSCSRVPGKIPIGILHLVVQEKPPAVSELLPRLLMKKLNQLGR